MFSLFDGNSNFGSMANQAVNDNLNGSPLGTLAQYMNNKYGSGNFYNDQGIMKQTPTADQSLANLMQANGKSQGDNGQGMQMLGSLIGALL